MRPQPAAHPRQAREKWTIELLPAPPELPLLAYCCMKHFEITFTKVRHSPGLNVTAHQEMGKMIFFSIFFIVPTFGVAGHDNIVAPLIFLIL